MNRKISFTYAQIALLLIAVMIFGITKVLALGALYVLVLSLSQKLGKAFEKL